MNIQILPTRLVRDHVARRTTSLIALCIAALVVAIAPQSSVAADTSSAKVSLAGLDLSTAEGIGMARERLHQAAVLACSRVSGSIDLSQHASFVMCVDRAMAETMPQIAKLAPKNAAAGKIASN